MANGKKSRRPARRRARARGLTDTGTHTAKKLDELFALHSLVYKHSSDTRLLHDTNIIVHTVSMIHKQLTPVRKHSARHFSHFTQLGFHTVRISHSLASLTVRLLIVCVIEQTVWSKQSERAKSMSHSLAFTQFAYLTVWLPLLSGSS